MDVVRTVRPLVVLGSMLGLAGFAWWATGLSPFTWPALLATLGGGLVSVAVGTRRRARARLPQRRVTKGDIAWVLLFAALAAWELVWFVHHPRALYPTLSSLANVALESHPIRTLAFAAWLVAGADLARR